MPQLVNAILSRHNFILLGLRGQAKSRILRGLIDLLDEQIPVVPGCEIHDDPLAPLCARCRAPRRARKATTCRSPGCRATARYVEKLATPDVTIADMIGDIDPIKAAQAGLNLVRRADDALRAAAAREPRHLRHQRAARPRRQDPGRACSTSSRKATSRSRATRSGCSSTSCWSSPPTPRTTRPAARSSRRSRTASDRRSARTIRRRASNAMAITRQEAWTERAGGSSGRDSRPTCARSSRRWRSRRAPIARSTSAPA